MKKGIKNGVLLILFVLNFVSFFVFASMIEWNPVGRYWWVSIINLAWIALFAYANEERV